MEKNKYNKLKDERIETIKNSEQTREVTEINKYKNLHDTLLFLIKTPQIYKQFLTIPNLFLENCKKNYSKRFYTG